MVRKVILIGFIGLLIALSNAMKEDKQSEKTFTFNGKNVGPALIISDDLEHTPAKTKNATADIFCPNTLKFYCKTESASGCVIKDIKGSKFEIPEKVEGDAIFEDNALITTCELVDSANLVELSVFDFLSEATLQSKGLSEDEKKKAYCEVNDEKLSVKKVYVPNEQNAEGDKQIEGWKTIKKNLQNFRSSTKFTIKDKKYTIKCENVATFWQRWGTWIIILGVLAAVIGVCYWFLCCDEDDDDEGKDENKAADP